MDDKEEGADNCVQNREVQEGLMGEEGLMVVSTLLLFLVKVLILVSHNMKRGCC